MVLTKRQQTQCESILLKKTILSTFGVEVNFQFLLTNYGLDCVGNIKFRDDVTPFPS